MENFAFVACPFKIQQSKKKQKKKNGLISCSTKDCDHCFSQLTDYEEEALFVLV